MGRAVVVGWRVIREVLWMVWRMEWRIWMSMVRLGFNGGTGVRVEGGILEAVWIGDGRGVRREWVGWGVYMLSSGVLRLFTFWLGWYCCEFSYGLCFFDIVMVCYEILTRCYLG